MDELRVVLNCQTTKGWMVQSVLNIRLKMGTWDPCSKFFRLILHVSTRWLVGSNGRVVDSWLLRGVGAMDGSFHIFRLMIVCCIWTTFRLQTTTDGWQNYEVSVLQALFCDTLDGTLHCGRYPAIVQRRVHSMINLWFRPPKAVMSRLKRAGGQKPPSDKMTPSSPLLALISHIG